MKTSKAIVIGGVVAAIVLIIIAGSWKLIMTPNIDEGPSVENPIFLYPRNLSTTELSRNSTKFFVVLDSYKIFARPYFATNETLTEIEITNSSDFSSNSTKQFYNKGFTSDCSNKRIYILKKLNSIQSSEQVLDVIQYDDNNKFRRIKRVLNMFNDARSIASDWTTGNLYWIERDEYFNFSIKVTNKSFGKPEYVVQPTLGSILFIGDIQVYPKKKEIFFIQGSDIWYTSTSSNSTPKRLLSKNHLGIRNLVIDYELNKLCFFYLKDFWKCVDIADSTRPINGAFYPFEESSLSAANFAVADNAFYWITYDNLISYRNSVNGTTNEIASTSGYRNFILSFFSLNCSCELNDNATANETPTILSSRK